MGGTAQRRRLHPLEKPHSGLEVSVERPQDLHFGVSTSPAHNLLALQHNYC